MTSETVYKTQKQPLATPMSKVATRLIVTGGVLLALTLSGVNIFSLIAPMLFISGAGLLLMWPANQLEADDEYSRWALLAAPGAVLVALGSIIFVLDLINHFEAFSYLWTLFPITFAAGLMHAHRHNLSHPVHNNGRKAIRIFSIVGLSMAVLFELFVFDTFGPWWPLALIGYGLYLLFTRKNGSADQDV